MNRRDFLRAGTCTVTAAAGGTLLTAESASEVSTQFPADFLFGAATSCVQIEGAADADGKSRSIWDVFSQKEKGHIKDGSTPAVACDSYYRWKEDNALIREIGIQSYRFSIAWPRILPQGGGSVNPKAIDY